MAFSARYGLGGSSPTGIFQSCDGTISPIVLPGDPVPGGGTFSDLNTVALCDDSSAVFKANQDTAIEGIFLGFYRVRITKEKKNGSEMLAAKYNTETTLGFEANNDVPDQANYDIIEYKLK